MPDTEGGSCRQGCAGPSQFSVSLCLRPEPVPLKREQSILTDFSQSRQASPAAVSLKNMATMQVIRQRQASLGVLGGRDLPNEL